MQTYYATRDEAVQTEITERSTAFLRGRQPLTPPQIDAIASRIIECDVEGWVAQGLQESGAPSPVRFEELLKAYGPESGLYTWQVRRIQTGSTTARYFGIYRDLSSIAVEIFISHDDLEGDLHRLGWAPTMDNADIASEHFDVRRRG